MFWCVGALLNENKSRHLSVFQSNYIDADFQQQTLYDNVHM